MYACSRSHWGSWLESLCCRRDLLPRSMLTRSQRTRRRLSALCQQWPAGQREKLSNVRNGVIGRRCAILGPCPLCPRKRTTGDHLSKSALCHKQPNAPQQTTCAGSKRSSVTERPRFRGTKRYGIWPGIAYIGLMLAARITLPHFSVSSAMSLPKSAGEPGSTVPPRSASRALILGSSRAALTSLLSLSTILAGVFLGTPTPYHVVAS